MKKLVMAAAFGALAVLAESVPELAATAEIASFGDISKKVNALGAMINNPIVPMLLLGSGQQMLTQAYGPIRSDAPAHVYLYVRSDFGKAGGAEGDPAEAVLIYPSANGAAKMALDHPGSTKEADGTLHLLPGENQPEDRWVKFSADGGFCAFAGSAASAARAIADFDKAAAARRTAAGEKPLMRLDITARGLAAIADLQTQAAAQGTEALKTAQKDGKSDGGMELLARISALQTAQNARSQTLLAGLSGVSVVLDLNDLGLSVDVQAAAKPGARTLPAAGFQLPAGALDAFPAGTSLFAAVNTSLQGGYFTEADYRADCATVAQMLKEDLLPEVRKSKDGKKYAALLDELGGGLDEFLRASPYPAPGDWSAAALAFDAARHPYLRSHGEGAKLAESQRNVQRLTDRVAAALEKQWPGSRILTRDAAGAEVIDLAAVIDVAAAESGVKEKNAKEVAQGKKTVADVFGDTKLAVSSTVSGTKAAALVATPGFKVPAETMKGEAALAAALPEVAQERPAGALFFTPYAFARDVVLPLVAKFGDKDVAAQVQAMTAAMPAAAPNSAFAAAGWSRKDGSFRVLARLTANEIKNLGGAFNAFTAASMSAGAEEDDDDK